MFGERSKYISNSGLSNDTPYRVIKAYMYVGVVKGCRYKQLSVGTVGRRSGVTGHKDSERVYTLAKIS